MGDTIYTSDASGGHSFQVVKDLGNALQMNSLDTGGTRTGWDYVLSKIEDVSDGNMKVLLTSKKNPNTKKPYTIKGITDVKTFDRANSPCLIL